jgi:hypothetical protein
VVDAVASLAEWADAASTGLETGFQRVSSYPAEAPSKLDLALDWLRAHEGDAQLSGHKLRDTVRPEGVQISHVWWNKAKRLFAAEQEAQDG